MNQSLHKFILCLAICTGLGGCAGVNPNHLKPPKTDTSLQLPEPFVYETFSSILGNRFQYTLAPGKYKAKYEDDGGTYYAGPEKCFKIELISTRSESQKNAVNKPGSYRCGIYMPTTGKSEPKVYFYRANSTVDSEGTNKVIVGNVNNSASTPLQAGAAGAIASGLITALDDAEKDNIHFYRNQPEGNSLRLALRRE